MPRFSLDEVLNNNDELSLNDIDNIISNLSSSEIVVYHGSNIDVPSPEVDYVESKATTDFGQGFYATTAYEQACSWAYRKSGRKGGSPTVSVYVYDSSNADEYSFGESYTREWLEFIVECRQTGRSYHLADVIYGCVADDDVMTTIDDYMKGYVDIDEALEILAFKDFSDQFCFTTQQSIYGCLSYKGYIYV